MPVDRSLLPPLPGKPDWYLENAPQALDPIKDPSPLLDVPHGSAVLHPVAGPVHSEPGLLPTVSPLAAPVFPTVSTEPDHGRGLKRVRALAGKLKL
jgi:hypothetical protein